MHPHSQAVLDFWFGEPGPDGLPAPDYRARWWKKDPAFDAAIREQFGADLEAAAAGGLDEWKDAARGAVGYVVLCDQFSRNVFRDTPRAFAQDPLALVTARTVFEGPAFGALRVAERYFTLMPTLHSEEVEVQREGLRHFEALARAEPKASPQLVHDMWQGGIKASRAHLAIVERFSRFPHRNAVLGRDSTPEEVEFLKQPGSSF